MAANLQFNDNTCDYVNDLTSEVEIVKNSPITEYFTGKTIFLTGSSGFLGQLYLEKLLRFSAKLTRKLKFIIIICVIVL